MNTLYASNSGYARYPGVSLHSLLEHHRDTGNIIIYLLSVNMSVENQGRPQEITGQFGRELVAMEMGDLKKRFRGPVDTRGFDISAMTRLLAVDVLPEMVDRIPYLGYDTVILGNLEPLWRMESGTALVGMVPGPTVHEEMKAFIDLKKDAPYHDSGVLLMSLKGWREEKVSEELPACYTAEGGSLSTCNRGMLNGALRRRIMTPSPKYNLFTNCRHFRCEVLAGLNTNYEAVGEQEYEMARHHPVVIHYVGNGWPQIAGNRNHYRKYYEIYLSRIPWKGTPKETGKEPYMMAYWGMSHTTWLCPPVRMWISRRFGMRVIDSRKKERKK